MGQALITPKIAKDLGLNPVSKANVFHANGQSTVNTYLINLHLPNGVSIPFVKVTEGNLNGTDLLIGMDVISLGDFSISNYNNKTHFTFRVPSIRDVDYVAESMAPIPQVASTKISRNAPCPCGSGKKYKKCCASLL